MASPLDPESALANLQATGLTARCHNAFFKQKQLKALHNTLRNNVSAIKDAIQQDTHVSNEEAVTEVAFALDIVREHYTSVNVKKELEHEYLITNGKDAGDKREPLGVVFIEPQQNHTPFFSIIAPLSAAVAAGNCVALKVKYTRALSFLSILTIQLENNLRALPSLLRKSLTEALESDTFAIVSSQPRSESLSSAFQVLQESQTDQTTYSQLVSPASKVVAIVDRTADLALAAEQLVTARFAFGGSSPYAPDIILVNEYIKKDFLEHVLKHSIRFLAGSSGAANGSTNGKDRKKSSKVAESLKALRDSKSWQLNVITQGDNGAVVELSNPSVLPPRSSQPVFAISAITSLEHAISLVDEDSDSQDTLLAAYHFGTPSTGKYLSQFVNADVSFINHIPFRLLLGPGAPSHHSINVENRYTTEQFTRASSAYIVAPASQAPITKVLAGKDSRKAAADLLGKASQEIKEDKRADWIAIGYFEQGILIGLSLVGIPLVTGLGVSLFYGVRAGLRRWAFS